VSAVDVYIDGIPLADLLEAVEEGALSPLLDVPAVSELSRQVEVLLALEGDLMVRGDLRDQLETVGCDPRWATADDVEWVSDIYEARRREALLRGELWPEMEVGR
jgi:hypothetical protein